MTVTTTITEALAEIKVIEKRVASKQTFITQHLTRAENLKDPLIKDGGSDMVITREMQSLHDLREQAVRIRRQIAEANATTTVTLNGTTRTIADWLRWRRDVAPLERNFLASLVLTVERARQQAVNKGGALVSNVNIGDTKPSDIVVNMSEVELNRRHEELQAILETLDGQLSLKNATVTIEY